MFIIHQEPILGYEDKINTALLNLKNENLISEALYNDLHNSGSQPPRLYGLAK